MLAYLNLSGYRNLTSSITVCIHFSLFARLSWVVVSNDVCWTFSLLCGWLVVANDNIGGKNYVSCEYCRPTKDQLRWITSSIVNILFVGKWHVLSGKELPRKQQGWLKSASM